MLWLGPQMLNNYAPRNLQPCTRSEKASHICLTHLLCSDPQNPCLACRVQHEYLAAYITELALPEYSALQWLPSIIAAAAVLLARHICAINIPIMRSLQPWSPTLQHYSGYRCTSSRSHIHTWMSRLRPYNQTPSIPPCLQMQLLQHRSVLDQQCDRAGILS